MSNALGVDNIFQYKIKNISLYTSDGQTLDVRNLMVELDIYEDIFSPCITGKIVLSDALDVISKFRIHGNEFLEVEIDKSSLDLPIYKVFRIYKSAERTFDEGGNQKYTLYFCSEEMILSQLMLVSKSYRGLTTSEIINDILVNYLKVNEKKINRQNFEDTGINYDIIIPNMHPFAAINWLLTRSYSTNKSLFFFYENRDGFNLSSFETISKQQPYATYYRKVKPTNEPDNNIDGFTYLAIAEEFDLMRAAKYGSFSSRFLSLDIVSKEYKAVGFSAIDSKRNGILNKEVTMNTFLNRMNRSFYNTFDNMTKFSIVADGDTSRNPILPDQWLPQTASKLGQIQLFKMIGSLPGDVLLKAGIVIDVVIQEVNPIEGQTKAEKNETRSGKFMISSLHHKFRKNFHTTTMEMITDSIGEYLPAPLNTNEKLRELVRA